ncbi:MAG: riboflavin synthase [Acidimicrobiia bacterium]|nr:riboflavin synthase [Acidimicrobiia bacterium]
MFTGLVESVGEVVDAGAAGDGLRIRIRTALAGALAVGDSLAVNGVCLTVILVEGQDVYADLGPETSRVTTLGGLRRAQRVNLERAMRADGRVGGHFVQGHVDGTGTIEEIREQDEAHWLTISYPPALAPYLIQKGSIAVDGVSLTVAGLGDAQFDVMIIPFTWEHTSFPAFTSHDRVNLECDMLGKYVVRAYELAGFGQAQSYARRHG